MAFENIDRKDDGRFTSAYNKKQTCLYLEKIMLFVISLSLKLISAIQLRKFVGFQKLAVLDGQKHTMPMDKRSFSD